MATLIGRQGSPFPAYFYFIFLYFRYWLPLPFPDASLPKKIPFHFPPLNLQSPSIHQGRSCLTLVHQCYSHSSAAPSSEVSTELHVGWPLKYFNTSLLHFFTTLAASFPTSPPPTNLLSLLTNPPLLFEENHHHTQSSAALNPLLLVSLKSHPSPVLHVARYPPPCHVYSISPSPSHRLTTTLHQFRT